MTFLAVLERIADECYTGKFDDNVIINFNADYCDMEVYQNNSSFRMSYYEDKFEVSFGNYHIVYKLRDAGYGICKKIANYFFAEDFCVKKFNKDFYGE